MINTKRYIFVNQYKKIKIDRLQNVYHAKKRPQRYKKYFEILERKYQCEGDEYNGLIQYIKY